MSKFLNIRLQNAQPIPAPTGEVFERMRNRIVASPTRFAHPGHNPGLEYKMAMGDRGMNGLAGASLQSLEIWVVGCSFWSDYISGDIGHINYCSF
jgi:hypothetical protein